MYLARRKKVSEQKIKPPEISSFFVIVMKREQKSLFYRRKGWGLVKNSNKICGECKHLIINIELVLRKQKFAMGYFKLFFMAYVYNIV